MKLLVVCSSLDLQTPFSATPAWWQLLKALYEVGVELVVTAYHGSVPATLWWRPYPNPSRLEGTLYSAWRGAGRRSGIAPLVSSPQLGSSETLGERTVRALAQAVIAPRWRRHLEKILHAEAGVDAVLFLSVPPNHLRGVPTHIRRRFGLPILFYDGDVPASLPAHRGFASGFNIYPGSNLAEFDAVISNSKGGAAALKELGAPAVHTLYYGADPQVYEPLPIAQDIDVFFFGHTTEYRSDGIRDMLVVPSEAMPEAAFAVRGVGLGPVGRATELPYLSFSDLRRHIARSRVNLVITRQPHASVHASSTLRPFELAMMGACMVCNPCQGIEEWFDPEKELLVVSSAEEAIDRYRFLLRSEARRRALGEAARKRALAEHTTRHRAAQLTQIIQEHR